MKSFTYRGFVEFFAIEQGVTPVCVEGSVRCIQTGDNDLRSALVGEPEHGHPEIPCLPSGLERFVASIGLGRYLVEDHSLPGLSIADALLQEVRRFV